MGARHCLRKTSSLAKRHLILVGSMGFVLAAGKGRAGSYHLLAPLRRLSALALFSNLRFYFRWIPSEINPADGPSRSKQTQVGGRVDSRGWGVFGKIAQRSFSSALSEEAKAWAGLPVGDLEQQPDDSGAAEGQQHHSNITRARSPGSGVLAEEHLPLIEGGSSSSKPPRSKPPQEVSASGLRITALASFTSRGKVETK